MKLSLNFKIPATKCPYGVLGMSLDKKDRECQRASPCEAANALSRKKQKCSMVDVNAVSINSLEGTEGFSCGNQTNVRNKKEIHSQLQQYHTIVLKFVGREREETPIYNIPQLLRRTKKVMYKMPTF